MLLICFLLSVFTAKAGRIITDSISSQTLNSTVKFNVYVPGRFENSNDHYPVVYLLHGLNDTFELYKKMRMARIHAEFRVRDGKHNWEYWRAALRIALPFASRNFK